ncbi:MAG: flagellin [Pseudomonadota bacterium]
MANVYLSAGVRSNLLTMQGISKDMQTVENRLATGLKVNSAMDDPANYFTSQGLEMRAADLDNILDDMGQAVQTLKAADSAITTITNMIETVKAKANQAIQSNDGFVRAEYAMQYNELLEQISKVAEDAGYNGKNLLEGAGNDLSVYFNEDFTNRIRVDAVDYTDVAVAFGLGPLTELIAGANTTALGANATPAGESSALISTSADFTVGEFIRVTGTPSGVDEYIEIEDDMTIADFVNEMNSAFPNLKMTFNEATNSFVSETAETVQIRKYQADKTTASVATGFAAGGAGFTITPTATTEWASDAEIRTTMNAVREALDSIRTQAGRFGTNLTTIESRQNFAQQMTNHLEEGSGKLVLADINEESANLLTLQTRQQLSQTALSLTTQSEQSVLRLFG